MNPSIMQNETVLALCWTLIHSLWQGLVLALITGIIMIATRKSNAAKRYRLLTGMFFLFMIVSVITFLKEWLSFGSITANAKSNTPATASQGGEIPVLTQVTSIRLDDSLLQQFKDYFNTHASLIVTIWFIIFIARFIKLTAELVSIQRLKSYRAHTPAVEWTNKLQELMHKLGMSRAVAMLESGIVKVPLVMGILKPVILVPIGMLSQLPADEIEAILLHELAHIQRRDYFVNLLQSFAETIFFFNPALVWLSNMIREERENCCDDIAIAVTNNKTKFIDALIAFQEFNLTNTPYAMGFPGKKNQLLDRVKRIISSRNKTLNTAEKSILTFGIAILLMFSFAAAKNIPVKAIKETVAKAIHINPATSAPSSALPTQAVSNRTFKPEPTIEIKANTGYLPTAHQLGDTSPIDIKTPKSIALSYDAKLKDTLGSEFKSYTTKVSSDGKTSSRTIIAITRQGKEYEVRRENDKLTGFFIDGNQISEQELDIYADQIAAVERPYYLKQENINNKKAEISLKYKQDQLKYEQDKLRKMQAIQKAKLDTLMPLTLQLKMDTLHWKKDSLRLKKEVLLKEGVQVAKKMNAIAKVNSPMYKMAPPTPPVASKAEAFKKMQADDDARIAESVNHIKNIINDLQKEGVQFEAATGWFGLDNKQFVVNGQPVSPDLYEKFKAKYLKPNGWGYYYGPVQVTGRGIFMDYQNIAGAK